MVVRRNVFRNNYKSIKYIIMEEIEPIIKQYSIDAINILIYNDSDIHIDNEKIINLILQSMTITDIKTDEELYPHINYLDIYKNIYYYNKNNTNELKIKNNINIYNINKIEETKTYDLLIINSQNKENVIKLIDKFIKYISTTIIILNNFDYNINYANWNIYNYKTINILSYNINICNNNHITICNYYELLHLTSNIIGIDKFFLIKSSCLGSIRNRNHIVFCDKIHICMNNNEKSNILRKQKQFNKYNITIDDNKNYIMLKLTNVSKIKIHFYDIENDLIKIKNEESIHINELGNMKKYKYGPLIVNSLEYPINYLKKLYGNNVFKELVHSNITIKIPKYIYDCYFNQWSSYTSNYWKNKQINHLYKVYKVLKSNNIKCWIDCGTLLGAARNNSICLFDDDTDIGIFDSDIHKVNYILMKNNISLSTKLNYINDISFKEYYNMNISYNKKENINYTFSCNIDLLCEFRHYIEFNNTYISKKDTIVSNAHGVPGLLEKRAVDIKHFDNLETIQLGDYIFDSPSDYNNYLESDSRYGKGSIDGNPIRDCKPGVVVLYDDFM